MRPDRFGQSAGKEFIESKGRERDGAFRDTAALSQLWAYATVFGFPAYSEFNELILPDIEIYPQLRVRETYFDASTHEVLLSVTGDVSPGGEIFPNHTNQDIAGAFIPVPPGAPAVVVIAQTRTSQTLQIGGFCTSVNTLEGTPIPVQDFLQRLYELHALRSDFDDPAWLMVRNGAGDLVLEEYPAAEPGGTRPTDTLAASISLGRGSGYIYSPTVLSADRNLACGALVAGITMSASKTLMDVSTAGFSDWINQRRTLTGTGQFFTALRCLHSVGLELLQPPPIEMTDDWFATPPLGSFVGVDRVDLLRWARPLITPPTPTSIWVGALAQCNA